MTSRSSFFDLIIHEFKARMWNIAFAALILFFAFPVNALMQVGLTLDPSLYEASMSPETELMMAKVWLSSDFADFLGAGSITVMVLLLCLGVGTAGSGFSYLQDKSRTDFYHGIPLLRSTHFAAVNAANLIIVAVPYFVMSLIAGAIIDMNTGISGCTVMAVIGFAAQTCYFLLFYMTAVLAFILTGRLVTGLLGSAIFFSVGPLLIWLVTAYQATYFSTYVSEAGIASILMRYSSAFAWCADNDTPVLLRAGAALIGSALLYAVCLKIYGIRRSEAAGNAMAFESIKAPIKFVITAMTALYISLFFCETMEGSAGWSVFGLICGGLITSAIIEIIYNANFKKLFSGKLTTLAALIAAAIVFVVFRMDITGYDSYIPDLNDVSSAGVYSYNLDQIMQDDTEATLGGMQGHQYLMYGESDTSCEVAGRMQLKDTESVQSIARMGADYAATKTINGGYFGYPDNNDTAVSGPDENGSYTANCYSNVTVCWHLKNGRNVYRNYYFNLSNVRDELDAVYDSSEFKTALYSVLNKDLSDIAGVNYENRSGFHNLLSTAEDADKVSKLYETYCGELMGLTAEVKRTEYPVMSLQFKSWHFQELADTVRAQGNGTSMGIFNYVNYFPVYPSFTKTLALLEEYGVQPDYKLTADDVNSLEISCYAAAYDNDYPYVDDMNSWTVPQSDLIITDKEQIQEILDRCVYLDLSTSNPMYPSTTVMSVKVNLARTLQASDALSTGRSYYEIYFRGDDVPDYVKEHFGLDMKTVLEYTSSVY